MPELEGDFSCSPNFKPFLEKVTRGQQQLGKASAIPMLLGPVTYVLLSKRDLPLAECVSRLLPTYGQLIRQLQQLDVPEVQLLEPSLATDAGAAAREVFEDAYRQLAAVGCPIDLVTFYDDLGSAYPWAVQLPVAAIGLDFCGVPGAAAGNETLQLIRAHGFPKGGGQTSAPPAAGSLHLPHVFLLRRCLLPNGTAVLDASLIID